MSISGISSNDYLYQLYNTQKGSLTNSQSIGAAIMEEIASSSHSDGSDASTTDLSSILLQALASSDLLQQNVQAISDSDSAQSAVTATSSKSGSESNPLANDLNALEDALQSGDIESAQSLFSQIMQHMQPPPPDAIASDNTQSTVTAASSSSGSNLDQLLRMWTEMIAANTQTSAINTSA